MNTRLSFPQAQQDLVHGLWDDLARFDAARVNDALLHLLSAVADLVDAQNAYWFGAVRLPDAVCDPLHGWRPRCMQYLHPLPNDETFTRDRIRSLDRGAIDEATVAQARLAGKYRANRLRDLVSDDWFEGPAYKGYLARGVHDSLVIGVPVSAAAEGYYGFLRMRPDEPFTEMQRDLAWYALRPLTRFHRQVLLAHGLLIASAALSPTERRVLSLLLTDDSEKQMAAALGIAPSSIHTYVRGVLRKFGVSGRKGLVSLWLGHQS